MQAKRVLFAWHSHKVVVFCSCAVFRCLTMQLASVKVTRERGALLSPALVVEGGRALLALSAQRSVVCIGWCSHGACWHSIAPRSESFEVAAAHVHQSNLCNHTTTHFKHTLITSLSSSARCRWHFAGCWGHQPSEPPRGAPSRQHQERGNQRCVVCLRRYKSSVQ